MAFYSRRTGRALEGLLVTLLAACGEADNSAVPDAGSCCTSCTPGLYAQYCSRCPGLYESCNGEGPEGNPCSGLSGQALCDCLVGPQDEATCTAIGEVAIVTESPSSCVVRAISPYDSACQADPDNPPSWDDRSSDPAVGDGR